MKVTFITLGLYFAIGISLAFHFYLIDIKTFHCSISSEPPQYMTFRRPDFTNPLPDKCVRQGFSGESLLKIPKVMLLWPIVIVEDF